MRNSCQHFVNFLLKNLFVQNKIHNCDEFELDKSKCWSLNDYLSSEVILGTADGKEGLIIVDGIDWFVDNTDSPSILDCLR